MPVTENPEGAFHPTGPTVGFVHSKKVFPAIQFTNQIRKPEVMGGNQQSADVALSPDQLDHAGVGMDDWKIPRRAFAAKNLLVFIVQLAQIMEFACRKKDASKSVEKGRGQQRGNRLDKTFQ